MEKNGKLIYWHMVTPDGTILRSRYRHDYVTYEDVNGKEYMVDGGLDYIRASAHGDEEFFTVTESDDHELIREWMEWGTYGKNGDQPLRYVKLKDMSTDHITACLETQKRMLPQYRKAMEDELNYRSDI